MKTLGNWSIRSKLFLVFLGLVLVPFAIYTVIVLNQSERDMREFGEYSAAQSLRQSGQFITSRVETIKRALDFFSLDSSVREICNTPQGLYRDNLMRWNSDTQQLRKVRDAVLQNNPDITAFTIYMDHGPGSADWSEESQEFRPLGPEVSLPWYKRAAAQDRAYQWYPGGRWFPHPAQPVFYALRKIPDDQNLQSTVGWIRADIPLTIIEGILDNAAFSAGSETFVINSSGEILARSQSARTRSPEELRNLAAPIPATEARDVWKEIQAGGKTWIGGSLAVEHTDWRLVLLVPTNDMDAFSRRTRLQLLISLAVIAPLMFPLAWGVAITSTRRIGRLVAGLRSIESGQTEVQIPVTSRDEIGELAATFNKMAGRIRNLMDQEFISGQAIKSLELKALQAQINPHFLYNTLDLINCRALDAGNQEICSAVEALAKFYRLSLFGDTDVVSLAEELEHARAYFVIQNMRFGEAIRLVLEVPEDLLALPVMKIFLQPLVENAILHGIREKASEQGTITIRASRDGDLVIEVQDDGIGMDAGRLSRIQGPEASRPNSQDGHGYGVRNIDERLRLKYGSNYGLEFRSAVGVGTTVVIRMPAAAQEP